MSELTVAAGLFRGLMDLAAAQGADRGRLAELSGVPAAALDDQDLRVPFRSYVALMRAAQDLCSDPALALHYGESKDLSEISIVGLLGHASETMLDAMAQLNRYGRLVVEIDGPAERFQAHRQDGLWIVDSRLNPNEFPELTEATFARMVCGPRRFGVERWATEIHVTHPEPPHRAEYDRIFQIPVVFGSRWNALRVDEAAIHRRIALQPRYAFGVFAERADALLEKLESTHSTRAQVEALLMPILHTGEPRMEAIAARMGASRQSLLRKLKAEGLTYAGVLDDLRRRLALDYIGARRTSVNEAAYLVGFSEPAAFTRAFKRWTGLSPRELRKEQVRGRD